MTKSLFRVVSKNKQKKASKRLANTTSETILKKVRQCNDLFYKNFILFFLPNCMPFVNDKRLGFKKEELLQIRDNFYKDYSEENELLLRTIVHNGVLKLSNIETLMFLLDYISFTGVHNFLVVEELEKVNESKALMGEVSNAIEVNKYDYLNKTLNGICTMLIKNQSNKMFKDSLNNVRIFDGESVSNYYLSDLPF